ncbi:lipopolysaccharide biosynthesis protein, partial [bacterium]
FQGPDRGFWIAGIVLFMLQSSQEIGLELERARMQSKQFAVNSSLRSVLRLVITVILLKMGWGVWGLLVGAGVAALVPNIYAWYSTWRHHPARLDRDVFKALVSYGLPLLGVYALDSLIGQGSRLILNHYQGTEQTGLYSMVLDLLKQIVQIAVLGVNLAIFPLALRKFKENDNEGAKVVLKRGISLSLALSLPLALVFAAAPDQSSIVFGAKYRGAAPAIMPAIAFAMLLAGIKQFYFDLAFQFGYKTNQQFGINAVAAVVSVVLNFLLIPRMGLAGIAWATLWTYVVATGLSAWKGRAVFAMPWPWKETGMVAIASVAMIAAIRLLGSLPPLAALTIGAFVYGIVLLGTDYLGLRSKVMRKVKRGR